MMHGVDKVVMLQVWGAKVNLDANLDECADWNATNHYHVGQFDVCLTWVRKLEVGVSWPGIVAIVNQSNLLDYEAIFFRLDIE